jgi:hypothetical protein
VLGTHNTDLTYTVFTVASKSASAAYKAIVTAKDIGVYAQLTSGAWGTYMNADIDASTSLGASAAILAIAKRAFNDIDLITGGTKVTRTNGSADQNRPSPSCIGDEQAGSQKLSGDIFEIVTYNRVLSNSDLDQVGGYLATKYALTWTPLVPFIPSPFRPRTVAVRRAATV